MAGKKEKREKRKSLSKVIFRLVLIVALVIFVVSTILSLVFNSVVIGSLLTMDGESSTEALRTLAEQVGGFEEYANAVMETYHSIPEDIRSKGESPEYRAYFERFKEEPFAVNMTAIMKSFTKNGSYQDYYLGKYDAETGKLVYLLDFYDNSSNLVCEIGEWEDADPEEVELFINKAGDSSDPVSFGTKTERYGELITSGCAIKGADGKTAGLAMADVSATIVEFVSYAFTAVYFVILAIVIIIVIIISRIRMKRRIVKPIRQVSEAVENYARGRKEGKENTLYFQDLNIRTKDELQELSEVLAEMETDISVYEKNLVKVTAEQERFRTELSVATGIQAEMLPSLFPPYPDRSEFNIYASMNPAKEVGGDFYDFFLIDDSHFGLVMADVSGKGVPAALFMMSGMIIIRNLALEGYSPCEVLERANEQICKTNKLDMFVTVWFGILDLKTGVVTASNAGHEFPAFRQAGGSFELFKDKHGFVIGGMEGVRYKEYSFTMECGASLFLYTDGVPEATNAANELFGTDRMIAALNENKDKDPEGILAGVRAAVDQFVGDAPQFDDLTMMCLTFVHPFSNSQSAT